jgi:cellobiose phosphorylase
MYRFMTESLLGLRLEVDRLRLEPVLPDSWKSFKIHYRYRETSYHITIHNHGGKTATRLVLDGTECPDGTIPLVDDRREHDVSVEMG